MIMVIITDVMVMIQCIGNNGNNDIDNNYEIIVIVMVFWKV